jgi:septal ring factor EnvC (AmiA/AmiB activator)
MDNDQLLQQIRNDMMGMETRITGQLESRFEGFERRITATFDVKMESVKEQVIRVINGNCVELHNDLASMDTRLESIDRRLELHAGVLSHIVDWSNKYEGEMIRLSKELSDVQARLSKLENPAA